MDRDEELRNAIPPLVVSNCWVDMFDSGKNLQPPVVWLVVHARDGDRVGQGLAWARGGDRVGGQGPAVSPTMMTQEGPKPRVDSIGFQSTEGDTTFVGVRTSVLTLRSSSLGPVSHLVQETGE